LGQQSEEQHHKQAELDFSCSLSFFARDQLNRERKKERKIRSGFDCLCCVYTNFPWRALLFLCLSRVDIWRTFSPFFLLFSIFLFCFSYLPFYCAAAIAKLVCFFFTPRQCRPLNTNVGERK
jgi:hypothetical protein